MRVKLMVAAIFTSFGFVLGSLAGNTATAGDIPQLTVYEDGSGTVTRHGQTQSFCKLDAPCDDRMFTSDVELDPTQVSDHR